MWKDWFYFSSGEKKALILLSILVAGAVVLVVGTDRTPEPEKETAVRLQDAFRRFEGGRQKPERPGSGAADSRLLRQTDAGNGAASPGRTAGTPSGRPKAPQAAGVDANRRQTSRPVYPRVEKYAPGTVVELNAADTTELKKVPGIGSVLAVRIVKYRRLLGGYTAVEQLREVYGIDAERYASLTAWFRVDTSGVRLLPVNRLPADSLWRHPYISYRQARTLERLRRQKGRLTGWEDLSLLEEFPEADRKRLQPYLSFE